MQLGNILLQMAKAKGLIASRRPKAWNLGVKGRIQSQGEETDQNNKRTQDLRYAVLEKWELRRDQRPPKWSIPGPLVTLGNMSLLGERGEEVVQKGVWRGCNEGTGKGQG